ncbi:MAG: cysteine dioxygenase [Actinomycetales bacterium]
MTDGLTSHPAIAPALPELAPAPEPIPLEEAAQLVAGPSTVGVPAQRAEPLSDADDPDFAGFEAVTGTDLDSQELRVLAASVAARPELWHQYVDYTDDHRHYVSLYRDSHIDVWVLCWTPANDTGWHDHDISSGAVAVAEGALIEHNLAIGQPELATRVEAGQVFSFGPEHIHRLTGLEPNSVSIHAYSPPLWRMGQYAVSPSGMLRRVSVSYADELRPLD